MLIAAVCSSSYDGSLLIIWYIILWQGSLKVNPSFLTGPFLVGILPYGPFPWIALHLQTCSLLMEYWGLWPTPLVVFGRPRWAWPVLSRPRDSTRQRFPGTQLVNWFGNNSDLNLYLAVLSNGQTKLLLPKMLAIYLGQVLFDRLIYINQTIDKVRRSVSVPDQTFLNFPRDFHQVQIGRALSWPLREARWRRKEHWTYIFESLNMDHVNSRQTEKLAHLSVVLIANRVKRTTRPSTDWPKSSRVNTSNRKSRLQ